MLKGKESKGSLHKSYCYFKHVVAQGEIAKAVPRSQSTSSGTMLQLMELTLCILIQSRHLKQKYYLAVQRGYIDGESRKSRVTRRRH